MCLAVSLHIIVDRLILFQDVCAVTLNAVLESLDHSHGHHAGSLALIVGEVVVVEQAGVAFIVGAHLVP